MVCIPCILIPLGLWIYHRFIQPYVQPLINLVWKPKAVKETSTATTPPDSKANETKAEVAAGGGDAGKKKD